MKNKIMRWIEANNKVNSDLMVQLFGLTKKTHELFKNGVKKVGYYTIHGEFICELHE